VTFSTPTVCEVCNFGCEAENKSPGWGDDKFRNRNNIQILRKWDPAIGFCVIVGIGGPFQLVAVLCSARDRP
jgi:hypothetical protein